MMIGVSGILSIGILSSSSNLGISGFGSDRISNGLSEEPPEKILLRFSNVTVSAFEPGCLVAVPPAGLSVDVLFPSSISRISGLESTRESNGRSGKPLATLLRRSAFDPSSLESSRRSIGRSPKEAMPGRLSDLGFGSPSRSVLRRCITGKVGLE